MMSSRLLKKSVAEVRGVLHSTDASAGEEIPLYEAFGAALRALDASECLVVERVQMISAAGGDVKVFFGDAVGDLADSNTLARGTVAANGGFAFDYAMCPIVCSKGKKLFLVAPAGAVDVLVMAHVVSGEGT